VEEVFVSDAAKAVGEEKWNQFLNAFVKHREEHGGNYIEVVQSLPLMYLKWGRKGSIPSLVKHERLCLH